MGLTCGPTCASTLRPLRVSVDTWSAPSTPSELRELRINCDGPLLAARGGEGGIMGSIMGSGVSGVKLGSAAAVVAELETRNNALRDAIAARRRQAPPLAVAGSPGRSRAAESPNRPAPPPATRPHSPRLATLDARWSASEVFGVLRRALAADRTAAHAEAAFALLDRNHDGLVGADDLGRWGSSFRPRSCGRAYGPRA